MRQVNSGKVHRRTGDAGRQLFFVSFLVLYVENGATGISDEASSGRGCEAQRPPNISQRSRHDRSGRQQTDP
jgi:hypothetical protein